MSTALYRRYRSARFADLIGQEHVAQTLLNEVRAGSLAHAYLFAGIRGTGKTSTARILARAVNCLDLQDGEPCNVCAACTEILGGGAVDVLEIDAASNRGIDEMRDLRDKVKFLPASLRRKVYIIDEAHMLTTEAWNAFLKTLEEPPPHVLFVLATTEPHKVPETVRSRVQRFDFRRVDRAAIARHLARIADAEGAAVEADALDLLARAGEGSVRDALSLLDQALASGIRPVTVAVVRRALGLADPAVVRTLLVSIASRDPAGAMRAVNVAFEAGADSRQLLREAARLARAAELVAIGYPEGVDLGADDAATCAELAAIAPTGLWVDALDRFAEAEANLRQQVDARLTVELAVLRLAHAPSAPPPTHAMPGPAISKTAEAPSPPQKDSSAAPAAPPKESVVVPAAPQKESVVVPAAPQRESLVVPAAAESARVASTELPGPPPPVRHPDPPVSAAEPTTESAEPAAPSASATDWPARWPALIDLVNRRDRMLAGVLRDCRPVESSAGRLVVGAPFGFHEEQLRNRHTKLVECVGEFAGQPTSVDIRFVGTDKPPADAAADPAAPPPQDPAQAVLSTFPGSRITGSRLRDHAHE